MTTVVIVLVILVGVAILIASSKGKVPAFSLPDIATNIFRPARCRKNPAGKVLKVTGSDGPQVLVLKACGGGYSFSLVRKDGRGRQIVLSEPRAEAMVVVHPAEVKQYFGLAGNSVVQLYAVPLLAA